MKPALFEYFDPPTLAEAVSLLRQYEGEARPLAGGQSLVPLLNMRLARPGVIVDLNRIAELDYIRDRDGRLAIGALTRQRAIERSDLVRTRQPLLHAATRFIAHPQIRNRGTIGGSLAHADPAAEYPAVAAVLDAEIVVTGPAGERVIEAKDFFVTYLTTALQPAEIVTEVRVPVLPARTGWSVVEVSRRHGDFALAGVAATLTFDRDGVCSGARIALFGVAPTPLRASASEELLAGRQPDRALLDEAARLAGDAIETPLSDVHASAEYRRHLGRVLTRRALDEATQRAAEAA